MVSMLRPAALCTDRRPRRPAGSAEGRGRAEPHPRLGHFLGGPRPGIRGPRLSFSGLLPANVGQTSLLSPHVPHLLFDETGLGGLSLRVLTV